MADNSERLSFEPSTKSVQDLVNNFRHNQLELSPPFQRRSVWNTRDRSKLIDSILSGFPLPSILLYERSAEGRIVFDVIDGKQRIETLMKFMGHMRGRFTATIERSGVREELDWKKLCRQNRQHELLAYRIPTTVVHGGLAEVIELFIRINSTGKALTTAERRNARYYTNAFLRAANLVAKGVSTQLASHQVLSEAQMSRMKHVELVCEVMLSAHTGDVVNKKSTVDKVMRSSDFTASQVKAARQRAGRAIRHVFKMLPQIRQTRFRQVSDFYSLAVLMMKFEREGLILNRKRRNALAAEILLAFAAAVDRVGMKTRKMESLDRLAADESLARDYLLTVKEGTDRDTNRRRREEILRGLLEPLFERKDSKRTFSLQQRRILWNTTAERCCTAEGCKTRLTWDDFTIDHVRPYSKGGRTELANAALMCARHNSSKGARWAARRRRAA
ncbi:MAG TPA: DUF262 domain-containing protein [Gemmatimonadaceae bacterium]|nr:DUF262 domain-containing protein [Gemmatimonadaceae bacterium]